MYDQARSVNQIAKLGKLRYSWSPSSLRVWYVLDTEEMVFRVIQQGRNRESS